MRVKGYLLAVFTLMFSLSGKSQAVSGNSLENNVNGIRSCAPSLRSPGSSEGEAVAEYIAGVFEQAGLYPFFAGQYIDEFTAEPLVGSARKTYRNVAGIIYGRDLSLDGEYIVIGAHYDYNGENDNLSGITALLSMAESVKDCVPGRNVIFLAFDGYELGLLGSRHFMAESTVPAESICLMVNLDGIGSSSSRNSLFYYTRNITEDGIEKLLAPARSREITVVRDGYPGRTDTEPFTLAGIPSVHITTQSPAASDSEIDYGVLGDITDLITVSACDFATSRVKFRPTEKEKRKKGRAIFFEGGIKALAGTSFIRQEEGKMRGKTMFSYGGGLYGQLNLSYFGLRPEVEFVRSASRYQGGNISMNSVVVPVSFVAQSPPLLPVLLYINVGGYYRYTFSGKSAGSDMDFSGEWYRNGAGLQFGLGMKFKSYGIGVNTRYGLTDMKRANDNKMTERATYCTLSYTF